MIVSSLEIQILAGIARLQKDMDDAKRIVGNTMREVERAASMARTALGSLGAGLGAAQLVQATDRYTKYTAQLKLATQSTQEHAAALSEVRRISTLAQADVATMGTLYARIARSTRELGLSQIEVSRISETIGLQLKVSGATATEAASAMLQLSQAFGSGVLRGEEFNAVNEASPKLMRILAEAMGVEVGALRDLASQGRITGDVMARAFSDKRTIDALREQAKEVQTISGAFTVLGNKFTDFVGQSATSSGTVSALSGAVLLLANNLDTAAKAFALIAAVKFAGWAQRVVAHTMESVRATNALAAAQTEAVAINSTMAKQQLASAQMATRMASADVAAAEARRLATVATHEQTLAEFRLAAAKENVALADHAVAQGAYRSSIAAGASSATILAAQTEMLAMENTLAAAQTRRAAIAEGLATTTMAQVATGNAATAAKAREAEATVALTAAETNLARARVVSEGAAKSGLARLGTSIADFVKANPLGVFGLALWGAYEVADHLGFIDKVFNRSKTAIEDMKALAGKDNAAFSDALTRAQTTIDKANEARAAAEAAAKLGVKVSVNATVDEMIVAVDAQLKALQGAITVRGESFRENVRLLKELRKELTATAMVSLEAVNSTSKLTHDEIVMQKEMQKLAAQFGDMKEADYLQRVNELLHGKVKISREEVATVNAHNEAAKADLEAYNKRIDAMASDTASVVKDTEQLNKQTSALTMSEEQLRAVADAQTAATIAKLESTLVGIDETNIVSQEAEMIRDKIAALRAYQAAVSENRAASAAKAQRDEQLRAEKDFWKSIDKTAHDTFVSIMNGGKDVATRLKETFKNVFFDWLYQMTLKKWIVNISATATGTGASGMAMAGGIGGGAGGFGDIGNWMNVMKLGFGDMAASFTSMAGSISGALQGMGVAAETAGSIGVAGAYAGAGLAGITLGSMIAGDKKFAGMSGTTTSAVGAGLGMLLGGPIGGVVGGALGGVLNAAFGRGPKVSGTTTLAGQFGAGGFSGQYQTPWQQSGGWFSGGRSGIDVTALTAQQSAAFSSLVVGSKAVFDNLIRASGDASRSLTGWTFAIDRQVSTQEQANQLAIDMASSMGDFLIPELRAFIIEGENLADTAVRMRDTFVVTDAIMAMVGQSFNVSGLASMGMRGNLVGLLGGTQAASTAMQGYYNTFFSEQERTLSAWESMAKTLRGLGVVDIPTTNDQFRALIEAQDLNTKSGQETFATLISLSGTFDSLTKTTQSLTSQTDKLATNLATLSTSSFATLVDYTRALRLQGAGAATSGTVMAPAAAAFAEGVQNIIAAAPAPTPVATVPFAPLAATVAPAAIPFSAANPNPANVAAKAKAYQDWQQAEGRASLTNSSRALIAAEKARAKWEALPAFADGGLHAGGVRMVGENGPELEFTGPSRIVSNSDTRRMLDNTDVIASVDALRAELRSIGLAISAPIQKSYKLLDRWNGEGMPEVREA